MRGNSVLGAVALCGAFAAGSASAATLVMDFESHPIVASSGTSSTPYTEDGMTISPVDESALSNHYDVYNDHPHLSPDPTNTNLVLHEGNDGSRHRYSLGGSAFDLLSVDIIGWLFGDDPVVTSTVVTIQTTAGGTATLNASAAGTNPTGIWDLSGLAGFSDIVGFDMFMPNPDTSCSAGNNCPNFAYDNVTFRTPPATGVVPVPASLPLLAAGLVGLGLMARRRRASSV